MASNAGKKVESRKLKAEIKSAREDRPSPNVLRKAGARPILTVLSRYSIFLFWLLLMSVDAFSAPSIPGKDLFSNGIIPRLQITIPPEGLASLRTNARSYVEATVQEGKTLYQRVGIHLKGATGSYRGIDDKPALTLSFGKFTEAQSFHGLKKIHLNNSVEDPSYVNEYIGGELFRAAGVPAPRVGHAVVELNGRPLGFYVLMEAFTEQFLEQYFRQTNGNLYEPGTGHDVNEPLDLKLGAGPKDGSDLSALTAAALEPDLALRWERLGKVLDLERFVSFMAMEVMAGHRDGYCLARNNFRLYHDTDSGKFLFFPHGMDVLLGKPDNTWKPRMSGLLARSIMAMPKGQEAYRARFETLFTNVFKVAELQAKVDAVVKRIRGALSAKEGREIEREAQLVKERMAERRKHLARQLAEPELKLMEFRNGVASLNGWKALDVPKGGSLSQSRTPDGKTALLIRAGPTTSASWRSKVKLARGRYTFEGMAKTEGVAPLTFGKVHGATLRVQGTGREGTNLVGTTGWQKLTQEFEVTEPEQELELICELRASAGQAWFETESLRLRRRE
jgi:spore coat protein H